MTKPIREREKKTIASRLREWWTAHGTRVLRVAVALMALAALLKLSHEFYRLVWDPSWLGAIDLKLRHKEVHGWFAGRPLYTVEYADYPPATYMLLWPFLGWLPLTPARWLWGATTALMLVWLARLLVRESTAQTLLERRFIVLLLLSRYATWVAIGNGQLIVHILPLLLTALLGLQRESAWRYDICNAALAVAALVSPTIAAPFFWIVLFAPGRLRPALLVVLGYGLLTLFASALRDASAPSVMGDWLVQAQAGAAGGAVRGGYANLHSWLAVCGLADWNMPASLLMLSALGAWVYYFRRVDLWLLLGVSAIVARLWTYHRAYDDLLIMLPMITLFRITKQDASVSGSTVIAGVLLAVTWVTSLTPVRPFLHLPLPWSVLFVAGQTMVWMAMLIFLLNQAVREQFGRVG